MDSAGATNIHTRYTSPQFILLRQAINVAFCRIPEKQTAMLRTVLTATLNARNKTTFMHSTQCALCTVHELQFMRITTKHNHIIVILAECPNNTGTSITPFLAQLYDWPGMRNAARMPTQPLPILTLLIYALCDMTIYWMGLTFESISSRHKWILALELNETTCDLSFFQHTNSNTLN